MNDRPTVQSVKAALVCASIALLVSGRPARTQEIDPIGALLEKVPPAVEPALLPAVVPPPVPPQLRLPPPPVVVTRAPDTSGRPVTIDELDRTPDRPLTDTDRGYEARLRASFQAAAGAQGPLNGRWFIRSGEQTLYVLQLVDKGQGYVEGSWRDPNRRGTLGFIDSVQRTGDQLTITLRPRPNADPITVTLQIDPQGRASGEMIDQAEHRKVTLSRQ